MEIRVWWLHTHTHTPCFTVACLETHSTAVSHGSSRWSRWSWQARQRWQRWQTTLGQPRMDTGHQFWWLSPGFFWNLQVGTPKVVTPRLVGRSSVLSTKYEPILAAPPPFFPPVLSHSKVKGFLFASETRSSLPWGALNFDAGGTFQGAFSSIVSLSEDDQWSFNAEINMYISSDPNDAKQYHLITLHHFCVFGCSKVKKVPSSLGKFYFHPKAGQQWS